MYPSVAKLPPTAQTAWNMVAVSQDLHVYRQRRTSILLLAKELIVEG